MWSSFWSFLWSTVVVSQGEFDSLKAKALA